VYSSHFVDVTDKTHILVDGRNTSDHFAISRSCPLKPNRVYSTKLRRDRADLQHVGTDSLRVIAV